jgi:GxxExxY protein
MAITRARITSRSHDEDRIDKIYRIIFQKLRTTKSERCGSPLVLQNSVNSASKSEYDLAGRVIGLAMKVHRTLGPGFLESVYQNTLLHELAGTEFKTDSDKRIQVKYGDVIVGDFKADLVVNDQLIVELKAVSRLAVEHEIQLVNYLTATGIDFGLLKNFGGRSLEFKKKFRTAKAGDPILH